MGSIETRYLTGREYAAILSLFGAVSHYSELYPVLEKRARMVPGLWEKMQAAQQLTDEILDEILPTIPTNKLWHVKADLSNVQLYIKIEPPGSVHSVETMGYSYTPTKTLNELLCYVMEHECLLCDKTPVEARKCPIKRMFDDALPHEVTAQDAAHCRYSDMSIGMGETA